MDLSKDTVEQIILKQLSLKLSPATVLDICKLSADMSLRSYFRLSLSGYRVSSALVMYFDSVRCPEYEGEVQFGSDRAYLELSQFYRQQGWPVPETYLDCLDAKFLLIEDLGDSILANLIYSAEASKEVLADHLASSVRLIGRLQEISARTEQTVPIKSVQRRFSARVYLKEMKEFVDYYLLPLSEDNDLANTCYGVFEQIAARLEALPQVLAHRDFHTGNLMIDGTGGLRVIDFQDSLQGPRFYDLVSLINDRDVDLALGQPLYRSLFDQFVALLTSKPNADTLEALRKEYALTLLQRDLKVSGRLSKMVIERGMAQYQKWVPNTVVRVGRHLEFLAKKLPELDLKPLAESLAGVSPEISLGRSQQPWF